MTTLARLGAALLLVLPAQSRTTERQVGWDELPAAIPADARVRLIDSKGTAVSGRLVRIEPEAILLDKDRRVRKANIAKIETRGGPRGAKWQVIGAAIGAAAASPLVGYAVVLKRNEGGIHSNALVGAAVGIMAGAALLGFLVGRGADENRIVIVPR